MSDAIRALLSELLDVAEQDLEFRARLRALARDEGASATAGAPLFLSVAEVVRRSGLSDKTVRRAIAEGELRSSKRGGRRLVAGDDFEEWVAGGRDTRRPRLEPARRPSRVASGSSFASTVRSRGW